MDKELRKKVEERLCDYAEAHKASRVVFKDPKATVGQRSNGLTELSMIHMAVIGYITAIMHILGEEQAEFWYEYYLQSRSDKGLGQEDKTNET